MVQYLAGPDAELLSRLYCMGNFGYMGSFSRTKPLLFYSEQGVHEIYS